MQTKRSQNCILFDSSLQQEPSSQVPVGCASSLLRKRTSPTFTSLDRRRHNNGFGQHMERQHYNDNNNNNQMRRNRGREINDAEHLKRMHYRNSNYVIYIHSKKKEREKTEKKEEMSECERNEWNLQKMNNKMRVTVGHHKAKHNNDNNII